EKRPDEWPPPRAPRGAKGREDERAEGPHERSPRPDERPDEWAWPNQWSYERPGADERTDERARTYGRAHERSGSDERPHQRLGPDQRSHERPRTHERTDERPWRAPADRFSRGGTPRGDAQRRMEALSHSSRGGRAPPGAVILRAHLQRSRLSDSNRRTVQRLGLRGHGSDGHGRRPQPERGHRPIRSHPEPRAFCILRRSRRIRP